MILNCDKLFYSLTNFSLGYGLDLFLLLFCVLFFLYFIEYLGNGR